MGARKRLRAEKIKEGNIVACVYTGINNDMLLAKRI